MILIGSFFERDKHRIETDFDDDQVEANVDDVRVVLLLKNLLSNALRYSTEEDGPVRIKAYKENGDLILVVEDHGPGFSDDQKANFGEPFYRGDPSRTRDTGGTGLGLYLAKLVAELASRGLRPESGQEVDPQRKRREPFL